MSSLPTIDQRLGGDTIARFDAAATWRLQEADLLRDNGRDLAAIYLYGYVIEIRLRAARYRLLRFTDHQEITRQDRDSFIKAAKLQGIQLSPSPHNLTDEALLLAYTKKNHGNKNGYSPKLRDPITRHAIIAWNIWRPVIRYRTIQVYSHEVNDISKSANWFTDNYIDLWS